MKTHIDVSAIEKLRNKQAPLYYHYPRQNEPQDAYIEMDKDGNVSADFNGEIGPGVDSSVWDQQTLRYSITPEISGTALVDLVTSEPVAGLLARIHAGHRIEWDGNNYVGRLSQDANQASEKLDRILDEVKPDIEVCSAEDWLVDRDFWDGGDLAAAVAAAKPAVDTKGCFDSDTRLVIYGDVREAILNKARSYVERDMEGLNAGHLAALVAEGEITQDQADEYVKSVMG